MPMPLSIKIKNSMMVVPGKTELSNPGEEPGKGYSDAGITAKHYIGRLLNMQLPS